ncbi:uncharacterized protein LOC143736697 [Siphateles boraxobius]|uniref:uncharacterized protein LOC143736697 n=1 Tax=Siphateles boraxobius TaxID=180520 RepID=UPI0040629D62
MQVNSRFNKDDDDDDAVQADVERVTQGLRWSGSGGEETMVRNRECVYRDKYPVWYRLHHTCKNSVLICLMVWAISCGYMVIDVIIALKGNVELAFLLNVFLFLLPYPLVVFSFVGSWRALSHSVAVTPDEQKRILRILALVLFNYTVLFLPTIVQNAIFAISFESGISGYYDCFRSVSGIMLYLNPLADSLLYVFIRKDANSMLRYLCCKKVHENQV